MTNKPRRTRPHTSPHRRTILVDDGAVRSEWDANPDVQSWARRVREKLVPMLEDSSSTIAIVPHEPDVKMAVELGMSILMGKPLIIVAPTERHCPQALAAWADEVVIVEPSEWADGVAAARMAAAVQRMNVIADAKEEGRWQPDVLVRLTQIEAERLYASAALYEVNVQRMEGLGEAQAEVAQSALTKLARGIAVAAGQH